MSGAQQADRSGRRPSSFSPMQGGVGHSRSRTLDRTTYHTCTATTNAREPSSGQQMHGDRMERSASSSTVEWSGGLDGAYTGVLSFPTVMLCRDALMSLWRWPRWLCIGDWSKTLEITQSSLSQNASCAFLSANPPGESRPICLDVPSGLVTLYSGPSYFAKSACGQGEGRFSTLGCKSSAQRAASGSTPGPRARAVAGGTRGSRRDSCVLTRTVLCAATHGLPAAARMSQGPSAATSEARAAAGSRSAAISGLNDSLAAQLATVDPN
jgi:hypothetical protein